MELTHGKKDNPRGPPSRLILYLQSRALDTKENHRIIKCVPDTRQALQAYSSIDHALNTYGPGVSKVCFISYVSLYSNLYVFSSSSNCLTNDHQA